MSCNNCLYMTHNGLCTGTQCKEGGSVSEMKRILRHDCYSNRYMTAKCEECPQKDTCMTEHNSKPPYRTTRKEEAANATEWSGHVYAVAELNDDYTINLTLSFDDADIIIKRIDAEIKRKYQ